MIFKKIIFLLLSMSFGVIHLIKAQAYPISHVHDDNNILQYINCVYGNSTQSVPLSRAKERFKCIRTGQHLSDKLDFTKLLLNNGISHEVFRFYVGKRLNYNDLSDDQIEQLMRLTYLVDPFDEYDFAIDYSDHLSLNRPNRFDVIYYLLRYFPEMHKEIIRMIDPRDFAACEHFVLIPRVKSEFTARCEWLCDNGQWPSGFHVPRVFRHFPDNDKLLIMPASSSFKNSRQEDENFHESFVESSLYEVFKRDVPGVIEVIDKATGQKLFLTQDLFYQGLYDFAKTKEMKLKDKQLELNYKDLEDGKYYRMFVHLNQIFEKYNEGELNIPQQNLISENTPVQVVPAVVDEEEVAIKNNEIISKKIAQENGQSKIISKSCQAEIPVVNTYQFKLIIRILEMVKALFTQERFTAFLDHLHDWIKSNVSKKPVAG